MACSTNIIPYLIILIWLTTAHSFGAIVVWNSKCRSSSRIGIWINVLVRVVLHIDIRIQNWCRRWGQAVIWIEILRRRIICRNWAYSCISSWLRLIWWWLLHIAVSSSTSWTSWSWGWLIEITSWRRLVKGRTASRSLLKSCRIVSRWLLHLLSLSVMSIQRIEYVLSDTIVIKLHYCFIWWLIANISFFS